MFFPVILKLLLNWVEETNFELNEGLLYAGALSISIFFRTLIGLHSDHLLDRITIRERVGVRVSQHHNFSYFLRH